MTCGGSWEVDEPASLPELSLPCPDCVPYRHPECLPAATDKGAAT